jgi:hypothetical protein
MDLLWYVLLGAAVLAVIIFGKAAIGLLVRLAFAGLLGFAAYLGLAATGIDLSEVSWGDVWPATKDVAGRAWDEVTGGFPSARNSA